MVDLVLRPSGRDSKPWALALRYHDLGGTDYAHVAYVTERMAWEIIKSGEADWLYGPPAQAITPMVAAARVEGNISLPDVWPLGTRVSKKSGSSWHGVVVGYYSTSLTPAGYCIESEREPGSVQIYPAAALTKETGE